MYEYHMIYSASLKPYSSREARRPNAGMCLWINITMRFVQPILHIQVVAKLNDKRVLSGIINLASVFSIKLRYSEN
jgi:hypothetical protein